MTKHEWSYKNTSRRYFPPILWRDHKDAELCVNLHTSNLEKGIAPLQLGEDN